MTNIPPPVIISVAPNGARKTKDDHPNIPLSAEEIGREAALCAAQGAALFHLHVRTKDGKHLLDAGAYKDATKAIRREIGNDIIVQITTEACGIYNPKQQMTVVKKVKPEAVSIAIKEIMPIDSDEAEEEVAAFFKWLYKEKISPQFILYSDEELKRFHNLRNRGIIPGDKHFALFVLGRYTRGQVSEPKDLLPFLKAYSELNLSENLDWAVCAFGKDELGCTMTAAALEGHVRIGFENNMHLVNGNIAQNNAELIRQFKEHLSCFGRKIATIDNARAMLGCEAR